MRDFRTEGTVEQSKMNDRRGSTRIPAIRFLRLKEVLSICGKSRSSIYDAIKKGEFPRPVKLGANSSAWINTEIEEWVERCISARTEK
jgi:prophage regulatory protein